MKVRSPFMMVVGLFLDPQSHFVREVLDEVPLDLLQFHGDECPADCSRFGRPYIKAVPMRGGTDVAAFAAAYSDARGLLLDSHSRGGAGGTGTSFDWKGWPRNLDRALILAGGLTPANVAAAVRETRPYAVDVSSGVESRKGIKDLQKMQAFVEEVRRVDCE